MSKIFEDLWRARNFVISSIKNEIITRYARSSLGGLWLIAYPLSQIIIYAFVLSAVMAARLPGIAGTYSYAIYLTAGIVGWSLFIDVVSRCLGVYIDNGNLLKKMAFPRIVLPVILAGSTLINNFLLLLIALIVFALLGHNPGWSMLWLPVLMLLTLALALSIGLILGILNVFFRDVGQIVPILLQFGFWLAPIVYVIEMIPERWRFILHLNPMTAIIQGYQNVMVFAKAPDVLPLLYPLAITLVASLVALRLFRRAGDEMVDAL